MLSENFEKNVLILTLYRVMSHYWNFIKQHQIKFIFIMLKTERIFAETLQRNTPLMEMNEQS